LSSTKRNRFVPPRPEDPMNVVPPPPAARPGAERPRVEGDREQEILESALDVLGEVGYDRMTMDAVATRARASKATLYRRWQSKAALVIDALCLHKDSGPPVDTGNFRDDLIANYCGLGGFADPKQMGVVAAMITAIHRDAEFAEAYRSTFVASKVATARALYERAKARGEIRADLDIDLMAAALPGIVLHRVFVLGESVTPERVTQIIDQIIVPACRPLPTAD
jgi:AcrR family transcriptional regulator